MNKIVVITGASSGLGLCLYNMYKEKGDTPICIAKDEAENIDNFYLANVNDEERIIEVFNQIKEKYGHIDILINNAGFGISGSIELEKSSLVKNLMDVNFMGAFYCYKYALPLMSSGAKIINMSSICALIPIPYRGFYCCSKSALHSMSLATYMELKRSKISVVSVCPGQFKSNFEKNRIKSYETSDRYKNSVANTAKALENDNKRMPVEKVAKIIIRQTYKKNPKPIKVIGFQYKVFYFFSRILPTRMFLYFVNKFLGK